MEFGDYLGIFLFVLAIATFVIFYRSFLSGELQKSLLALLLTIIFVVCLVFLKPWLIGKS